MAPTNFLPGADIRFFVHSRIAECVDAEATRYAVGAVQLVIGADGTAWLSGTDSRVLAGVRLVQCEGPAGTYLVPARVLRLGKRDGGAWIARLNGVWFSSLGSWGSSDIEGRFPHIGSVLVSVEPATRYLSLDPRLLLKLAEALGSETEVTLLIPETKSRVITQPIGAMAANGNGIGVIMPKVAEDGEQNSRKLYQWMFQELQSALPPAPPKVVPFDRALLGC